MGFAVFQVTDKNVRKGSNSFDEEVGMDLKDILRVGWTRTGD